MGVAKLQSSLVRMVSLISNAPDESPQIFGSTWHTIGGLFQENKNSYE
jgi:hypothetical protein